MTTEDTTSTPVCYRHPDRETFLSCSRCSKPICGSCSIEATVGQRCPECVRAEGTQKVIPTGPRSRRAPATTALIAIAVVFHFLSRGPAGFSLFDQLAQYNSLIEQGQLWRLFSPVLLHADLTHLLFNMWALWVLGPQVERGVGSAPYVGAYLASAGMGGAFYFLLTSSSQSAVGASGAVFGLFGIWLHWSWRRRNTAVGQAYLRQISVLLLINAALPLMVPRIAWQAHLGGLVAGFVISELWSRVRGPNAVPARVAITVAVAGLAVFLTVAGQLV